MEFHRRERRRPWRAATKTAAKEKLGFTKGRGWGSDRELQNEANLMLIGQVKGSRPEQGILSAKTEIVAG
jgi:hypothetical protein